MKKLSVIFLILICVVANVRAAEYLISPQATTAGEIVNYKEVGYTVGVNAFADFASFLATEIEANSTVYVADGKYAGNITISTDGLKFFGNNAFRDWTVTRSEESIITGTIYIKASNITINGFKFTEGGRIESTAGTNASPLSGIKVLYNYFAESTVKRGTSTPLVEIGNVVANADANAVSSQCRYKNCEASHNYFVGDATHYPNCISFGGAFGTTSVYDNYFYDGGSSVYFANAQGTLNIANNVFKNVGKTTFTAPDGGNKGDFCIAIYRSGYANTTTANILANEFDGCYGQASLFPLIRIYQGTSGSTNVVTPVGFRVNVNENTFKNKISVLPSASHNQAGEKVLLYNDLSTGKAIKYNLSNNHFDNRLYKFAWVTLDDGQGCREIYADQFTRFDLGSKMSTFGTSVLTNTDVANHATGISLGEVTVLQSFDIDPVTGDMYFIQLMPTSRNNTYNTTYGFGSTHDALVVTRVPCTKIDGYAYTYSTSIQTMDIGYGGHGTNMCLVRDKNGQAWLWSGAKASLRDGDDVSGATARWKFKNGSDINLDGTGNTDSEAVYFNVTGANDYPACDETSRYLCIRTTGSGKNKYDIFDLDQALEGKKKAIKTVEMTIGDYVNSSIPNDKGYNTWAFQSFDIKGDYIYTLEGLPDDSTEGIATGDPTLVMTCYNWRTNKYCWRTRLNYGRINNLVSGEPEGMVIRHDQYGHANLYVAVVNGAAGARKVNVYKYIIDYHTGYDEANATATNQGDDTYTKTYLDSDYPAMSYTCDTKSIDLTAASTNETPSQMVTITNGEYAFGRWYGVVTGEDADAFSVKMGTNDAFSATATATITFNSTDKRKDYNATLRLFSPLATSNVESNDVVIPITGAYTGVVTDIDEIECNKELTIRLENKTLTIENIDVAQIKIYSISGLETAKQSNCNSIGLDNLSGIYVAMITDAKGYIYTHKIVL